MTSLNTVPLTGSPDPTAAAMAAEPRLRELEQRLAVARQCQHQRRPARRPRFLIPDGTLDFASRAGNDVAGGVLVGLALGATVDALSHSWPYATLGLVLLCAGAGVRLSYQTARRMADPAALPTRTPGATPAATATKEA